MINVSRPENKIGSLPIESSTLRDPSSIVVSTHIPSMKEVFLAQLASQSIPLTTSFPAPEFFGHYEQVRSVNPTGRQSDSTKTSTSRTTPSSVVPLASVDTLLPGHRTFLADPHSFNKTSNPSSGVPTPIFNGEICRCGICSECRTNTTNYANGSSSVSPICSARLANDSKNDKQSENKTHGTCATTLLYHLPEQNLLKRPGKDTNRLPVADHTVKLLQQPLSSAGCSNVATTVTRTSDLPHSCTELIPVSARCGSHTISEIAAPPSSDVLFASAAVQPQGDTTASTEYQNSQFLAPATATERLVPLLPHLDSTNVTASSYPNVCSSSTETVVSNISISPAIKLSRTEVSETVSSPLHTVPVQLKSHVSLSSHLTRSASCHQTTGRFILPNKTTREVLDAPTNVNTTATAITPQVHLISLPPTSHGSSYIPTNTLKTAVPASTSLLCVNAQMLSSGGASFVLLPIAAASLMQSLSPSIPQAKAIENSAVLTGERQPNTAEPIDGRAQLLFLQTTGKEQARSCGNLDLQSIESPEVVVQQPCTSGGLSVTPPPDILGTNSADCPVSASFPNSASDPECLKTPLLPPLSSLSFSHTAATHENSAPHFEDRHQTVLPSAAHLLAPKSSSSSEVLVSLTTAKTTAVLKSEQSMSESGGGGRFTPRKRHQCPFCAKTCERKDNLQAHIRTHTGERPYPCRFCPKAFPQKDHLRAHIRTHTGEKPYHCVQCLKAFAQLGNLHRHVKTHRR